MPTTQEDFDVLGEVLQNNNIERVKKILQNFDVTAIDRYGWTCLMFACHSSSSPEYVKLIFKKIDEVGDKDLLKSQLTATTKDGWNCLMFACRSFWSPEVMKLLLDKILEVGGPALLHSQLTATNKNGSTCLELASGLTNPWSAEVIKLVATLLFHFDLFKEQHEKLDAFEMNILKARTGINSSSWTPDAASLAEVKAILQGGGAAAKKKAEDEVIAKKKKAVEEAAVAKKKAEEEAAAKKKAEEEAAFAEKKKAENQSGPLHQEDPASFNSPPPSRCFKRGVPDKKLEDAVNALFSIKEAPENRPDLKNWIPDRDDARNLLHYLKTALPSLKERPAIQKLITDCGLTDDDIKILHSYKVQNPYPVYLWLNGWLGGDRRDDFVKEHVAPFFTLLYRAMEKLPKITTVADRAIKVNGIASLKNTYHNYKIACAPGKTLSFWGFSSFSTESDVVNREEFVGKPQEEAIVYSCGKLEGVDMEPFAPNGLKCESEILPLCPCVLEVQTALKMGQKLVVAVKQLDHADFAYVLPK